MAKTALPRGLRNCNPLNIIISNNKWLGKVEHNTDGTFEQFTSITMGLRAAFVILRSYMRKGIVTPYAIIHRWAPDGTVKEKQYLAFVCDKALLGENQKLDMNMFGAVTRLVWAMAWFECGRSIDYEDVKKAYRLLYPASN